MSAIVYSMGIVGVLSDGLISMSALNFIPLMSSHWAEYLKLFAVGLAFTAIYFFVFRFLILKFNFKTPGREDDENEVKLHSKKEYREKQAAGNGMSELAVLAAEVLDGVGGKDTNCITRLRLNVKDETLVKSDTYFKGLGTNGVKVSGKNVQVIIGLIVQTVRDEFEKLL